MNGPIAIAGAGPAGSLLAIYLARQGHDVTVYESRPDLRRTDIGAGRSINLALATRGIVPLVDVGVIDQVNEITIPMRGRMVHAVGDPTPELQPYGIHEHEVIHSVSRAGLNAILLDAAEATGHVTIEFERRLEAVDFDRSLLHFHDSSTEPFSVVFGADGANSPIRQSIIAKGTCAFEPEMLDHDYKELTVPPGHDGTYLLDPYALHVWPRGEFMLIALANPGGDFTVTLFAPTETFNALTSAENIRSFFNQNFPEFAALVPDLVQQFVENPTGKLGTVRVTGWSYQDRAALIGDAAHGIVPFHGQGMNAAMESVRVLDRHLRASPDNLTAAFAAYESERKPNTDAIADMAIGNYIEMRAGVIDPDYLAKRKLALELQHRHPSHLSPRYNMVMFSTMPYAEAQKRARRQGEIIEAAVADPSIDIDTLISGLPRLPHNDPLADPRALSTS